MKSATFMLLVIASLSACKRGARDGNAPPANQAKEPANQAQEPTTRIGDLTPLGDGTHFNLGLIEDPPAGESRLGESLGSSGANATTRNLYFYDATARRGHWLLPNDRSIIAGEYVLKPEADDPQHAAPKPRWELFYLIAHDTNGDGVVGTDDRGVLALTNIAGDGVTELVRDVVEIANDPLLIDERHALAKVELPTGVSLVQIDLEKRSVESVLPVAQGEKKKGPAGQGGL